MAPVKSIAKKRFAVGAEVLVIMPGESGVLKLTLAITQRVERLYVKQLLPAATPAGILIDDNIKNQFADNCQIEQFASIALEHRATRDNWSQGRKLNRNNFMDQQHLIALPYVDFFVTDDARLTSLIGRISVGFPFGLGTILTKAQFDTQYPASIGEARRMRLRAATFLVFLRRRTVPLRHSRHHPTRLRLDVAL